MSTAFLTIVSPSESQRLFVKRGQTITIGSSQLCNYQVRDRAFRPIHLRFSLLAHGLFVETVSPDDNVELDQRNTQRARITGQSRIVAGDTVIEVTVHGDSVPKPKPVSQGTSFAPPSAPGDQTVDNVVEKTIAAAQDDAATPEKTGVQPRDWVPPGSPATNPATGPEQTVPEDNVSPEADQSASADCEPGIIEAAPSEPAGTTAEDVNTTVDHLAAPRTSAESPATVSTHTVTTEDSPYQVESATGDTATPPRKFLVADKLNDHLWSYKLQTPGDDGLTDLLQLDRILVVSRQELPEGVAEFNLAEFDRCYVYAFDLSEPDKSWVSDIEDVVFVVSSSDDASMLKHLKQNQSTFYSPFSFSTNMSVASLQKSSQRMTGIDLVLLVDAVHDWLAAAPLAPEQFLKQPWVRNADEFEVKF